MADLDAALVQQFLDISVAERKMVIQPDGVLDDGHGEAVAVRLGIGHVGSAYPSPIKATQPNNVIEQEHRSTRRQERSQQDFRRRKRAQEFLSLHARITNLHHHSRTSVTAVTRRNNQNTAFQTWSTVAAGAI